MKSIIILTLLTTFLTLISSYFIINKESTSTLQETTVKLLNKCELIDGAFMVVTVPLDKEAFFVDGVAKINVKKNSLIRLEASSKYPGFSYSGIPKKAKKTITLIAECSSPERLDSIFDSMRNQFNKDKD